jgi:hypothetical protein
MLFSYVLQILWLAQMAFTIWMLVDCYRRGADYFWFFLIIFTGGLGAWIYFFVIKIKDFGEFEVPWLKRLSLFQKGPSLAELRYRADQSATLANQLALGERLVEHREYAEATPYLEAVLAREPDHCHALFALATCYTEQGQKQRAIPLLEKVIARDRIWSDYSAWRLLIQVKKEMGDAAGALATSRELARLSPTLRNRCVLGEHLLAAGLHDEAEQVLDEALEEHRFQAGAIRRKNRRWAKEAERLLKQVQSPAR